MSNYGFDTSDSVKLSTSQFPVGKFTVFAVEEENVPSGVKVTYDIVTGEHKGSQATIWYNTLSEDAQIAAIAKQNIKRIADACKTTISATRPIKGLAFGVEVVENEKKPQYTNVKRYFEAEEAPKSDVNPFA